MYHRGDRKVLDTKMNLSDFAGERQSPEWTGRFGTSSALCHRGTCSDSRYGETKLFEGKMPAFRVHGSLSVACLEGH